MDRYREDLRDAARAGRPTADRTAAGSSLPAAPQRTAHLRALDHLAAGLRAACPDGAVLSWAQVAQYTLAEWMRDGQNANMQILSLASVPLFSLVQLGQFDSDLYYRLNTIRLDLVGREAHQAAI